jgi:hypothetical protein
MAEDIEMLRSTTTRHWLVEKLRHANVAVLDQDQYLHDPYTGDFDTNCHMIAEYALASSIGHKPRLLEEALQGSNAKQWADVNEYEISQLEKNQMWDIVILPDGKKPIPVMAVLKSKPGEGGGKDTFHVRYVAGGHKQVEGVDYSETFAAAAKIPSFRVVLGNTAQEDCVPECAARGDRVHASASRSPPTRAGRHGLPSEERIVWVKAGRMQMAEDAYCGFYQRSRI